MNRTKITTILLLGILAISLQCTNREEEENQKRMLIRMAGEAVFKSGSGCISLCKSHLCVREYARVTGMDFNSAAAEMQGDQTRLIEREMEETREGIEMLMQRCESLSSERLKPCYARLVKLHSVYLEALSLVKQSPVSTEGYELLINQMEDKLKNAKQQLDATC